MLRFLFITTFLCSAGANVLTAQNQISSFPYIQGFETTFVGGSGNNIAFAAGWLGSPVADTNRICRDLLYPRTGLAALACLPTSTTRDTITISLNLSGRQAAEMRFFAASDSARSNVGGTRTAIVYVEASADGGATYIGKTQIGDSTTFQRRPTPYRAYTYSLPTATDNSPNAKIRFIVTRGAGTSTTARFLMDDVTIMATTLLANDFVTPTEKILKVLPTVSENGQFTAVWQGTKSEIYTVAITNSVGMCLFQTNVASQYGQNAATIYPNLAQGWYTLKMMDASGKTVGMPQKIVTVR